MRPLTTALLCSWLFLGSTAVHGSDSVFLEELTWTEVDEKLNSGTDTVIIPTGGTEQNGPHMVLGKHNFIVRHAAGEIARRLGRALVAPVVAYVPEGGIDRVGHMKFPGTITLPREHFTKLVEYAARSFKLHGFDHIVLIGDSGGNLSSLQHVQDALNEEWADESTRVYYIDRFTRGTRFFNWLLEQGETPAAIGSHAGIMDTSVMLAVDPSMIRMDKLAPSYDFQTSGVIGDPRRASVEYGAKGLEIQIGDAVTQINELIR